MKKRVLSLLCVLSLAACEAPGIRVVPVESGKFDADGIRTSSPSPARILARVQEGAGYYSIATTRLIFMPSPGAWKKSGGIGPFSVSAAPIDSSIGFYIERDESFFDPIAFWVEDQPIEIQNLDGTHVPYFITTKDDGRNEAAMPLNALTVPSAAQLFPVQQNDPISDLGVGEQGQPDALKAFTIDLPDATSLLPKAPQQVPNNAMGWQYRVFLGDPNSGNAIRLTDLNRRLGRHGQKDGAVVSYLPLAACRAATITLISPQHVQYELHAQVATPEWVELIRIPPDGKIRPGPICGATREVVIR